MFAPFNRPFIAGALAALIAGCGGSDGVAPGDASPGTGSSSSSLKLAGTAATGLALAGSTVDVKCASGTGTATSDSSGQYTITITDGALPCMIKVTAEVNGTTVTLHSVTEAGTSTGGTTTAVANVTPLTEMIVAQMAAALPSDLFASFGSGSAVTAQALQAATASVLTALKDATGIDVTAIDPFKATLVAATTTSPSSGNAYDKLLDQLGTKVAIDALPLIVTQIATTASAGSSTSTTLTDVMTAVDGGSMPGCPAVMSGKYRILDHFGRTTTRQIDFKTMKFNLGDGGALFDITALDSGKPCEFVAEGTFNNVQSRYTVAMGANGAGTYRAVNITANRATIGHIFPVQAHPVSVLQGTWTFVQTGSWGVTSNSLPAPEHSLFKAVISATGTMEVCDYDLSENAACVDQGALSTVSRADGGFDLVATVDNSTVTLAQTYGFRAPNGSLTIYGTTNASGSISAPEQTHFVGTLQRALPLPSVGTRTPYWVATHAGSTSFSSDTTVVTTVDAQASTITRTRTSDGQVSTLRYNDPIPGVRYRAAGFNPDESPIPEALFLILGTDISLTINASQLENGQGYFYSIAVGRP